MDPARLSRAEAQEAADRLRIVRNEIAQSEIREALHLTEEQAARFDAWAAERLSTLARQFDVDTSDKAARLSWGMRIASTLGGLALCAAVVLFFNRFWGYLSTPAQISILIATPLVTLAATEYAARKERTLYFAGLLALLSLTAFVMNLIVVGQVFNMVSTQNALLAWGIYAVLVAYRYGLRVMLVFGLASLLSYLAGIWTSALGYGWSEFPRRPEHLTVLGLLCFGIGVAPLHAGAKTFAPVYRAVGQIAFLLSVLGLAEWGATSYLPIDRTIVERLYEMVGLAASALFIWAGIRRSWTGLVNAGSIFFVIFLFARLYHWWWNWMPSYLFFAIVGLVGVGLVAAFRRMRTAGSFA